MLNIYNIKGGKENKLKQERKDKKRLEHYTSKAKFFGLILIVPFSQSMHNKKQKWLVSLKLEDQGQKMPQLEKYCLEDVLWKTPSLIHYF